MRGCGGGNGGTEYDGHGTTLFVLLRNGILNQEVPSSSPTLSSKNILLFSHNALLPL